MKVSVSILSVMDNFENSIEKINNTNADYLHLDIMDSSFTDSSTFSISQSRKIRDLTKKQLDVHIMSTNLDEMLDKYIKLDPEYITFHVEVENVATYIEKVKEKNIRVGLAINPDTDINKLYKYLDIIDLVLVMSVVPGKGGQTFIYDVVSKLKQLNKMKNKYNYLLEVDGGINNETIKYVKDYVDIVVSGSYITNKDNYQSAIDSLK